jgi:hypothetical protein
MSPPAERGSFPLEVDDAWHVGPWRWPVNDSRATSSKESIGGRPTVARRSASRVRIASPRACLRKALGSDPARTSLRASSAFFRASARPVVG